ncbi:MAG: LysR family transcriptional regulator [Bacteroidota bacterium]
MNYTIHQLQVFLKVVEYQSVTKASEELFMTQPAASIQLKKFQEQFKIPLTEVVGKKLSVTEFGLKIAEIAKRVMLEIENITYETEAFQGLLTGKLTISSASTGKYVIPYFLSAFMENNPGIDLVLDVTNKTKVIESLRNNEIDFAMVSTVPEGLEVNEEILLENRLYLVSNSPTLDKSKPLIYREEGSATRKAMERFYSTEDKNFRKKIELTSNEAVKQAVIAGLGNSIMPLIGIHNELESGQLFIIDSKGLPIKTEWRLVWLKNKRLSPLTQSFLEYIRDSKSTIYEKYFQWYFNTAE